MTTPLAGPRRPRRSKVAPKSAPFTRWIAIAASGPTRARPPRSRRSEYHGMPKTRAERRLGGRPHACRDDPRHHSPHRPASISSRLWRPSVSTSGERSPSLRPSSGRRSPSSTRRWSSSPCRRSRRTSTSVSPASSGSSSPIRFRSHLSTSSAAPSATATAVGRRSSREPRASPLPRSSPASLRRAASSSWRACYRASRAPS